MRSDNNSISLLTQSLINPLIQEEFFFGVKADSGKMYSALQRIARKIMFKKFKRGAAPNQRHIYCSIFRHQAYACFSLAVDADFERHFRYYKAAASCFSCILLARVLLTENENLDVDAKDAVAMVQYPK